MILILSKSISSVGSTVNSDTTITISATDMSGNITNCDIFISLQDTIAPQLSCFSDNRVFYFKRLFILRTTQIDLVLLIIVVTHIKVFFNRHQLDYL